MPESQPEAGIFAIPSLWQTSRWLDQIENDPSNSFFASKLDNLALPDLPPHPGAAYALATSIKSASLRKETAKDAESHLFHLAPPATDHTGFFRPPAFEDSGSAGEIESRRSPDGTSSTQPPAEEPENFDMWMSLNAPIPQARSYKTWDAFMTGVESACQPYYLTEAGPCIYDALLSWETDPLDLNNVAVPVVEAKVYLAAFLSLAVGRESVFFTRAGRSHTFKPALPNVRLSGYSSEVLKGLEKRSRESGEMFLDIRVFIRTSYAKQPSRCSVALSSALDRILQILQQHLDVEGQNPSSVLRLQSTIDHVTAILRPLSALLSEVERGRSDEDILDLVFRHACVMEHKELFVRDILQEILRIVSLPWLELLEEWLGTRAEHGMPFTKANVGQTKGFIKVESQTCVDDFGQKFEDIDYRLDHDKLPKFFPEDVARLAFESGRNLRFIRESHPEHTLVKASTAGIMRPPSLEWKFEWKQILELEERVEAFRAELKAAVTYNSARTVSTQRRTSLHSEFPATFDLQLFAANGSHIDGLIQASMDHFRAPLRLQKYDDRFLEVLNRGLRGQHTAEDRPTDAAPHPSLLPVLSFGGLVSAQARIVNRESLRLLFTSHNLRGHLDMQRGFQLLGNGLFSSRLSNALFDPDLETAEREAGVARQGGVMGLRLGRRDTWPPASSELRLALMGVLNESYAAQIGSNSFATPPSGSLAALPGDLSFAVRDLATEDIEKCMNPDSLEALDFLRLAYVTPPELKAIITPVILTHYDRIFKFLLRMLRLMYVTDQLFRDVNLKVSRWREPDNNAYRFSREARHFVSCVAAYFLDTGIAVPWRCFQAKLDTMQADLEHSAGDEPSGSACSPETVREHHSEAVDHIMLALFLRKRQQPVLRLLEDIFNVILTYAKHSRLQAIGAVEQGEHTTAYGEQLYRSFKKKVQLFMTVCRNLTESSRTGGKGRTKTVDGLGDDSMVAQLLLKLDMNNYYIKP